MKRLLLITTALVTAVAPVSQALASASLYTQEQPDERDLAQGPRDRGRGDGGGRRPRPDNPSPPPQPPSPPQPDRPSDGGDRGGRGGGGDRGDRGGRGGGGGGEDRGGRGGGDRGDRGGRGGGGFIDRWTDGQLQGGGGRDGRDGRGGRGGGDRDDRDGRGGGGRDGRGGWDRGDRDGRGGWGRGDRDRDRDEFRRRWDRDHWRRDWNRRNGNDWWRRHSWFRDYSGFRLNFYFAPGYGYYSVPRQYWNRQWREGEYLPTYFWRYVVTDYAWYGLPYPPYGCQWVYVNNDILLIDTRDGYILEVVYRVWNW